MKYTNSVYLWNRDTQASLTYTQTRDGTSRDTFDTTSCPRSARPSDVPSPRAAGGFVLKQRTSTCQKEEQEITRAAARPRTAGRGISQEAGLLSRTAKEWTGASWRPTASRKTWKTLLRSSSARRTRAGRRVSPDVTHTHWLARVQTWTRLSLTLSSDKPLGGVCTEGSVEGLCGPGCRSPGALDRVAQRLEEAVTHTDERFDSAPRSHTQRQPRGGRSQ